MDNEKIKQVYHDLASLTKQGASPLVVIGDSVVGGEDDRKDLYELTASAEDARRRLLAASTVILTNKSRLQNNQDGTWTLQVGPFRQNGLPPCTGERFGSQNTGGWCSGFLVGPDIIVTAGHCGETQEDIRQTAYVFGFQVSQVGGVGTTNFNENQVYFGQDLIAHDLSSEGDFAIVRLDRRVTSPYAEPLNIRASGNPSIGSKLGVIGYPSGLPVKIAYGPETVLLRDEDPWLISNLDTYGGNSGSAVFNENGEVEGILVRGAQDYVYEDACFKTNFVQNSEGSEAVTKAHVFRSKIPHS